MAAFTSGAGMATQPASQMADLAKTCRSTKERAEAVAARVCDVVNVIAGSRTENDGKCEVPRTSGLMGDMEGTLQEIRGILSEIEEHIGRL